MVMDYQSVIFEVSTVIFLYMTVLFIVAVMRSDNSIADIAWGMGFVIVAVYSVIQSGEVDLRKMIVVLLVLLWGLRLSAHIFMRNQAHGEDFRYRKWRETWKYFLLRSYLQIFILQGFMMLIISTPLWIISFSKGGLPGLWDTLGLMVFGAGFLIEIIADAQLTAFKKDPANKGKLITSGLWAVSRHPNYFGEALVWWGISFYALSLPGGWIGLISPITITLLLRFVSGVPLLEKKYENHPDWADYKAKTAPFVPYLHFL